MRNRYKKAYLGLGSNIGNRRQNINKALKYLTTQKEINVLKLSSFYQTKPVGCSKQRDFLNAAVLINTTAAPLKLLKILKSIEKKTGRVKTKVKWGPRVIDIDILAYNNSTFNSEKLIIPHPLMHERFFVLKPFADIAPGYKHPVLHKTIRRLLREIGEDIKRKQNIP